MCQFLLDLSRQPLARYVDSLMNFLASLMFAKVILMARGGSLTSTPLTFLECLM